MTVGPTRRQPSRPPATQKVLHGIPLPEGSVLHLYLYDVFVIAFVISIVSAAQKVLETFMYHLCNGLSKFCISDSWRIFLWFCNIYFSGPFLCISLNLWFIFLFFSPCIMQVLVNRVWIYVWCVQWALIISLSWYHFFYSLLFIYLILYFSDFVIYISLVLSCVFLFFFCIIMRVLVNRVCIYVSCVQWAIMVSH